MIEQVFLFLNNTKAMAWGLVESVENDEYEGGLGQWESYGNG